MKVLGRNQLNNVAVLVLPLCTVPILNVAQEKHLIPIHNHPAVVPLVHTSFYEENRDVLYGDPSERPTLKITVIPSFNPVFTIAFNRYKITIRKAGYLPKKKNGEVNVETEEIRASKELYDGLSELFYYALLQTKVDTTFNQGLDGTTYYLSSFAPFKQRITGMLWSPRPESDMDKLTKIISEIYHFKEEREGELLRSSREVLERLKHQ